MPVAWDAAEGPAVEGDGVPPIAPMGGRKSAIAAETLVDAATNGKIGKSLGPVGGAEEACKRAIPYPPSVNAAAGGSAISETLGAAISETLGTSTSPVVWYGDAPISGATGRRVRSARTLIANGFTFIIRFADWLWSFKGLTLASHFRLRSSNAAKDVSSPSSITRWANSKILNTKFPFQFLRDIRSLMYSTGARVVVLIARRGRVCMVGRISVCRIRCRGVCERRENIRRVHLFD
ncbi:UNVERIFIED_CONTAM: hypothetical protein Slati_0880900 [Sesamum latifolium]|uniref:Uncharacterized protein n=1 Tax=Sesamum latifolium TaxID=2727402 RepID=A0AAW2XR58_9LAMI